MSVYSRGIDDITERRPLHEILSGLPGGMRGIARGTYLARKAGYDVNFSVIASALGVYELGGE